MVSLNDNDAVHPGHVLGILGTAVRRHYGSRQLARGLDRLAFDVRNYSDGPTPADPSLRSAAAYTDLDCDE